MGLVEPRSGNRYIKVMMAEDDAGRKVARFVMQTSEKDTEGHARINAENKQVFERHYGGVVGLIKHIEPTKKEFNGKQIGFWEITVEDGAESFLLSIPIKSKAGRGILFRLPNVDLTKPVLFQAGIDTEKEKPTLFTWLTQDNKTVPMKWTKDSPGDMPTLVEQKSVDPITKKETTEWVDPKNAQLIYLLEYVKKLNEQIDQLHKPKAAELATPAPSTKGDDDDDLPF